jgi:hypothetical protein
MAIVDLWRSRSPDDDIEVIVWSPEEWDQALQRSLDKLGLTWQELVEQAENNDFSSLDARKLWLMAGHRGRGG